MYKYSRRNNKLKTVGIIKPNMSATVSFKAFLISQITTKIRLKTELGLCTNYLQLNENTN